MHSNILSLVATLALFTHIHAAAKVGSTVHEKRDIADRSSGTWRPSSRLPPDSIVPVRIALKQNNLNAGVDRLEAISHPDSTEYGKHLTPSEVTDLFAPSDDAVQRVRNWLLESGIRPATIAHSDSKGWLAIDMTVAHAEHLFDSELYEFEGAKTGEFGIASRGRRILTRNSKLCGSVWTQRLEKLTSTVICPCWLRLILHS